MEKIKNNGEILAPVGSKEMLIAAVRSGADAVYLGAKDFSARRNAENFDLKELSQAIQYCHIRGVKVYLTLNILIKETEMAAAVDLAKQVYNLGVDGIIIEDLGLARILNENIPSLPLHASTQMSVHTASALPILKKMGFVRVVAAREMSKTDLTELCQKARELNMEIEVFIHGALCMCMSGQCQLSAFLGARSGNRGLCAGPCRLPFKAQNGTGYDLSLKDLSLLEFLKELSQMGVTSFKIEGRMKRPEYVAAATSAAKQSLSNGFVDSDLAETIKNVFSRSGFTDGYYKDSLGREMFGIRTKEDVLSANTAFPKLHELYRNERKSVGISVKAEICQNKPISLTLCDGEHTVTALGEVPQKAQRKEITYDDALKSITKLGGTPYFDEGGGVKLDEGLFVPASALNDLRRKAVEQLDLQRAKLTGNINDYKYEAEGFIADKKVPKLVCRFENVHQIPKDLTGISAVIFPLEQVPNFNLPDGICKIVDIPRGILSEKAISQKLSEFKDFDYALCGNLSAVEIAKKQGFKLLADSGLNVFNAQSIKALEELEIKGVTLSYELGINECQFESRIPKGIIAYGNVPLMLFKNCPLKNGINCKDCNKEGVITDRLGAQFPVRCRMGYSEMLNSVPIWLADRKEELTQFDFLTLYFTNESRERVEEVISAYRKGAKCDVKFTRGLYYKGTI